MLVFDLLQLASRQSGDAFDASISKLALFLELNSRRSAGATIEESFFRNLLGDELFLHDLSSSERETILQFLFSKLLGSGPVAGIVHALGYAPAHLVAERTLRVAEDVLSSCSKSDAVQFQYLIEKILSHRIENPNEWEFVRMDSVVLFRLISRFQSIGIDPAGIQKRFNIIQSSAP